MGEKRAQIGNLGPNQLFRSVIESTADGILVVDADGRVIHANARFARMWNIPDELLSKGDDDLMLEFVLNQLRDPQAFLQRVRELYGSDQEDFDTLWFDLIILDVIMPGMGGIEAFDRLREMDALVPVLLSSGYALEGRALTLPGSERCWFLQKPYGLAKLSQKLQEILKTTGPKADHS